MPTEITTHAVEKSTMGITTTLYDEDGSQIQVGFINSIAWTWTDLGGSVINSRDAVAVSPVANPFTIALSGDDLAIQSGESGQDTVGRIFTIEVDYDSDLGSGLNLRDSARVTVENLAEIT